MKRITLKIPLIIFSIIFINCGGGMKNFEAQHLKSTHGIELNGRVENVFKLFTAEGEKLWIKDWEPEFYYPETNKTETGTVFVTSNNGVKTIWTCVEFDEENNFVKYVRTIPDNNTAVISVRCSQIANDRTEAEVTYEFTSLSKEGNKSAEQFNGQNYKDYINWWEIHINKYLETL